MDKRHVRRADQLNGIATNDCEGNMKMDREHFEHVIRTFIDRYEELDNPATCDEGYK